MRSGGPRVELKTLQLLPKLCAHRSVSSIQRPVAGPARAQPELRAACILASAGGPAPFRLWSCSVRVSVCSRLLLSDHLSNAWVSPPLGWLGACLTPCRWSSSITQEKEEWGHEGSNLAPPPPSKDGNCVRFCASSPRPPAPAAQAPHPDPATLRLNRPFPASGSGCACVL